MRNSRPSAMWRENSKLSKRRRRPGYSQAKIHLGHPVPIQLTFTAPVASSASVSTSNYLAENIVFDSVTNKYWWVFQDASGSVSTIRMASSPSISSPVWTVETNPVLSEAGHQLECPHIVLFGSTWYIYYGRDDPGNIYLQTSGSVNTGYSATGITNPLIDKGTSGTWEDRRTFEPFVFKWKQSYYMLYMAENVANLYEKTGLAWADDPKGPWTKCPTNPVLAGDTGTWDAGQDKAADPFAFQVGDYWYVGVTATSSGKANWVVGFFVTQDFINYKPVNSNPILGHGGSGTFDSAASFRGAVTNFGGTYYFPYTGVDGSNVYRLGLTTLTIAP